MNNKNIGNNKELAQNVLKGIVTNQPDLAVALIQKLQDQNEILVSTLEYIVKGHGQSLSDSCVQEIIKAIKQVKENV